MPSVMTLTTREPGHEFNTSLELLTLGSGERSIRPAINIPLGGAWAIRLSANLDENDMGDKFNTYLQRFENDTHVQSLRARVGYDAGHGLHFVLTGFYSRSRSNNNEFKFLNLTDPMRQLAQSYDPRANDDPNNNLLSANFPSVKIGIIRGASASLETDLGGVFGIQQLAMTLVGGYAEAKTPRADLDADFSAVPFIHDVVAIPKLYRQLSQEIRFNGQHPDVFGFGHGINFVSGLYFSTAEFQTSDIFVVEDLGAAYNYCSASATFCDLGLPLPDSATSGISNGASELQGSPTSLAEFNSTAGDQTAQVSLKQKNPTYGFFGQFEYYFTKTLGFIGGVRYTYEKKDGTFHSFSDSQIIKNIANQEDFDITLHRIEHDLAPKFGLKWKVADDVDLYATWGQAYKSGGYNGFPLNSNSLDYEPEEATSYEFGIKARDEFLGGPVRISGAAFLTNFNNLQVSTFQGGDFIVLNAAKARSYGGEMEFHWRPPVLGGLIITTTAGYADARYAEYRDAPAIADSGQSNQDLTGQPLPLAARWNASLIPSYEVSLTPNFIGSAAFEVLYRGSRFLDVDDDPRKLQKATTILNSHVTLGSANQIWAVTFAVHNLTNQLYYDQALNQPLAPGNIVGVRTDTGRYFSANLSLAYGSSP